MGIIWSTQFVFYMNWGFSYPRKWLAHTGLQGLSIAGDNNSGLPSTPLFHRMLRFVKDLNLQVFWFSSALVRKFIKVFSEASYVQTLHPRSQGRGLQDPCQSTPTLPLSKTISFQWRKLRKEMAKDLQLVLFYSSEIRQHLTLLQKLRTKCWLSSQHLAQWKDLSRSNIRAACLVGFAREPSQRETDVC